MIEYNGMWLVSKFEQMELPEGWGIEQEITCVDATTYQVYMANMKSLFMDMIRNTDMVVFNRCKEGDPLPAYRRGIKVANQSAEVIFENEEGEMDDIFQDEMPFDINAPIIEIPPEDYGIWFVDSMDHPDRYVGKTVHFKARALKPRGMGSKFFVPGRTAMTCCADDTTSLVTSARALLLRRSQKASGWMLLRRLRLRREWNIRERESYFTQSM